MKPAIVTIGVYGFEEEQFFQTLVDAHVDTFCDVRARRAMRGSAYAFANSNRLQTRLQALNIRYLHYKTLAPSPTLRQRQQQADKARKVAKRARTALEPDFVQTYEQECLATLDTQQFFVDVGAQARIICLFCVERQPASCHRSLLATKLAQAQELEVAHLLP